MLSRKYIIILIEVVIVLGVVFFVVRDALPEGREIASHEKFLSGNWVSVATVYKTGEIERHTQTQGKYKTRKEDGLEVNNYNNAKAQACKWSFTVEDSLLRRVNNGNPSDSVSLYKVRMLDPETVVLLSQEDSTQYIEMRYNGELRNFFVDKMIDHGIWPPLGYKK